MGRRWRRGGGCTYDGGIGARAQVEAMDAGSTVLPVLRLRAPVLRLRALVPVRSVLRLRALRWDGTTRRG